MQCQADRVVPWHTTMCPGIGWSAQDDPAQHKHNQAGGPKRSEWHTVNASKQA